MPLLFSIGIHEALEATARQLEPGEQLCAFLDDVYALCEPARVRPIYDLLADALHRAAGIQLHQGKTRVWNRGGVLPENISDLGPDVWCADGIMVLGTPLGNDAFAATQVQERLDDERLLWDAIPTVPDLQSAWQILLQSAGPRANHVIRTLPPSQSLEYAEAHDAGIWAVLRRLLDLPDECTQELALARSLSSLPMRSGGLGLRSASRGAEAAYWASWADALPMIHQRNPEVAAAVVLQLAPGAAAAAGCMAELDKACRRLDHEGFRDRPSWQELRDGARPPEPKEHDPGEWQQGWQYFASSSSES